MAYTAETLKSPTGANLCLYVSLAANAKSIVQINHGLAEHAARYAGFAAALNAAGYHVYAQDHRGHGGTTADDAPPRMFAPLSGDSKVIADTDAIHAEIGKRHPGLPVITFGHSMGGLIALNHACLHPDRAAGIAIWNANFSAGILGRVGQGVLAYERFRLGHDVPSRLLPKLTFGAWAKSIKNRRTQFDWLSNEPSEVDAYIADPRCGWDASVAMWQDIFKLVFAGADNNNLSKLPRHLPIHIRGSGQDPATDFGKASESLAVRFQNLGFRNTTLAIDPQGRHECLNDINQQDVTTGFITWANQVVTNWQSA